MKDVGRVFLGMLAPMHESNILVYLVKQHSNPCWSPRVLKRLGPTRALGKDHMDVNTWQQLKLSTPISCLLASHCFTRTEKGKVDEDHLTTKPFSVG